MAVTNTNATDQNTSAVATPVPKQITNAQTVCNEKNEKNKPCWGHLKQLATAGEPSEVHLRGDDVLFKCQTCGTLYMGPPLGHVRDPYKQSRFVEAELSALLQAAGGTLPVIKKDARGVFVIVEGGGTGLIHLGDIVPTTSHLRLAWNAAYDTNPLGTIAAKKRFFAEARTKNLWISFSHDDKVAAGLLVKEEGKTPRLLETMSIS